MNLQTLSKKVLNRLIYEWRERTFQPYVIQTESEGETFSFLIASLTGRGWYDYEDHSTWPEMRFVKENLIQTGDTVVECGAHQGYTTILLARWVGVTGQVVSFEPVPRNARIIKKNALLNNLSHIKVYAQAVGNSVRSIKIYRVWRPVSVVRLDDSLNGIVPQLLKIDVDGYETEVIRGAQQTLAQRKTNLSIEIHRDELLTNGSSVRELLELLHLEEYQCWIARPAHDGEEGTSNGDDAVIEPFFLNRSAIPDYRRFFLFAIPR
jgi:hypothetical protein